jgi:hypothetical protein
LSTASTILGSFAGAALIFATDRGIKLLMG